MIQPKIQEVYIPTKKYITSYSIIEGDNISEFASGKFISNVFNEYRIIFTPEEFEQFKREFGKDTLKELFDWCEYRQEKSANSSKAAWNMIIDKLKELL
jgi:hypothetical protein